MTVPAEDGEAVVVAVGDVDEVDTDVIENCALVAKSVTPLTNPNHIFDDNMRI